MIKRKPRMFGTSGVRGATNTEITPELAMKLSMAFADWLGSGKVVMGRDTRFGTSMLCCAISAGLQSMGLKVIDCGIVPTPALGYALKVMEAAGGVMVTGSHMPPDRVGLIYMDSTASYIGDDQALEVEDRYFNGLEERKKIVMQSIGTVETDCGVLDRYERFLLNLVDQESIAKLAKRDNFRVVMDPGNGTASGILPSIIEKCGIEVIRLHDHHSGDPERPPEPRKHTLGTTVNSLLNSNASLAAATDLDADRVLFVDETGEVVSEDVMGAVFGKWIFEKCLNNGQENPVCVTPVNSSGLIDYLAKQYGVAVEYCRIGQPDTERVLSVHESRAVFAYEESGKYYFAKHVHWCDGILATLFLLQIMAEREKTLRELTEEFPRFYQAKGQFRCPDDVKDKVYESVIRRFHNSPALLKGCVKDLTVDGLKRLFNDDSWLLLRPSGTEPLFRLYSDAMTQARADELLELGREMVEESIHERRL